MITIEFNFNGETINIQGNEEDQMETIIQKFASKANITDLNSNYFIYDGYILKNEIAIKDIANSEDKRSKIMHILVNSIETETDKEKLLKKTKEIICPECKDSCKIDMDDYVLSLFGCKGKHEKDYIFLKDFEDTQKVDESKIICDKCKNDKSNTYNNDFFICKTCNLNLCPLCSNTHKGHVIFKYEKRNFICDIHNNQYSLYCEKCEKDICVLCEKDHNNHKTITYGKLITDDKDLKNKKEELKKGIEKLNETIKEIINMLSNVIHNFQIYYKIYDEVYNNYDNKNLNYHTIHNINVLNQNNGYMIQDLNEINGENDINNKFQLISDVYNKMNTKVYNEIEIVYESNKNKKIKIFDSIFVKNNKDKCKIIYKDKEYDLQEYFEINEENIKDNLLTIKLKGIKKITDASFMFHTCKHLISLPNLKNWDTHKITSMDHMFSTCESLKSLTGISDWDTSNVKLMSSMFFNSKNLEYIDDISNWNTKSLKNKSYMFKGCKKLSNIPEKFKPGLLG